MNLNNVHVLNESFGDLPEWLTKALKSNKSLAANLTRYGVDLHKAKYIRNRNLPRNAVDKRLKDEKKLSLFRIIDDVCDTIIYIPDVNNPRAAFNGDDRRMDQWPAITWLSYVVEYGYLDWNDPDTSNREIRRERAELRNVAPEHTRRLSYVMEYPVNRYGSPMTNLPKEKRYLGTPRPGDKFPPSIDHMDRYDKSGYRLPDPDKYKRRLNDVGLDNYAVRLDSFHKKIEACRLQLLEIVSNIDTKGSFKVRGNFRNNFFDLISNGYGQLSQTIEYYQDLIDRIDPIVAQEGIDDEKKSSQLKSWFQAMGPDIRKQISRLQDTVTEIKNKAAQIQKDVVKE